MFSSCWKHNKAKLLWALLLLVNKKIYVFRAVYPKRQWKHIFSYCSAHNSSDLCSELKRELKNQFSVITKANNAKVLKVMHKLCMPIVFLWRYWNFFFTEQSTIIPFCKAQPVSYPMSHCVLWGPRLLTLVYTNSIFTSTNSQNGLEHPGKWKCHR